MIDHHIPSLKTTVRGLRFTVEEQFSASKTGRLEDCEDAIYIGPHFVAVIDGASSLNEKRWNNGETSGRAAARLLNAVFAHIPSSSTCQQALAILNSTIKQFYKIHAGLDRATAEPLERLVASIAVISIARKEIWIVGDCQCLLNEHTFIFQKRMVDRIAAEARAMFLETELARGVSLDDLRYHDTGREFILPLLARQSRFENNPSAGNYQYTVVDGFPIPDKNLLIHPLPADIESIVLSTDGYPRLRSTLAASEQVLQDILREDPLLFRRHKLTKGMQPGHVSFDDRAYVRLKVMR